MPTIGPQIAVTIVDKSVSRAVVRCCLILEIKFLIAFLTDSVNVLILRLPKRNQEISSYIISLIRAANNPIKTDRSALPPIRKASAF